MPVSYTDAILAWLGLYKLMLIRIDRKKLIMNDLIAYDHHKELCQQYLD